MNTPVLQKYCLQGLKKVQKGSRYSNGKNKKKKWEFLNISCLNFTTFALHYKKCYFSFLPFRIYQSTHNLMSTTGMLSHKAKRE